MASFMGDASVGPDSAEMELAIEAASRSVDRACDRQFGTLDAPEARSYTAVRDYRGQWIIAVDDFATVDGLLVETVDAQGITTPITGVLPLPINAVANGRVWTQIAVPSGSPVVPSAAGGVRVTALWGWPEIPKTITLATLLQASRLYARRHAPFCVAGNEDVGQLRLLDKLDPDLAVSVRPFARVWGAV
ncbi:hypothetical protein WN67_29505 [Mycolicibacterium obuense]|uniref:Phage gp6-like head-tail connector protein n=1 Tax=Mycolicibacterium obuense TaxID=1807 RepID=A0A0M2JUG3_9MYCO|nr:hypothetical protein WN67_29505 [Mycolicibacterium obuense]